MKAIAPLLPEAILRVAPALAMVEMPEEVRSTCANCAMAPKDDAHAQHQRTFSAAERCCTYHPFLPNFAVGRILRRGDEGTVAMLARLRALDDGVSAAGVGPGSVSNHFYTENISEFGRFQSYRCPYWRGGDQACAIWRDRNAVCRTWHCKYVHGSAGMQRWSHLREALSQVEGALTRWCVDQGGAPEPDASTDAWVAWFLACAERVAKAEDAALLALADVGLRSRIAPLLAPIPGEALPDVLMASVREWTVFPDRIELCGYSVFDGWDAPVGIFAFLSRFDGRKTWQTILDEWSAEQAGPTGTGTNVALAIDRSTIEAMFKLGILSVPSEREVEAQPGYHMHLVPTSASVMD